MQLSDVKETEEAKREKLRTDLQERMEVLSQDLGDLEGAHQELAERVCFLLFQLPLCTFFDCTLLQLLCSHGGCGVFFFWLCRSLRRI